MFQDAPLSSVHARGGFMGSLKLLAMLYVATIACLASSTAVGLLPFDTMAEAVIRVGLVVGALGAVLATGQLLIGERRA